MPHKYNKNNNNIVYGGRVSLGWGCGFVVWGGGGSHDMVKDNREIFEVR